MVGVTWERYLPIKIDGYQPLPSSMEYPDTRILHSFYSFIPVILVASWLA
jgi:hypothetical protein